MEVNILLSLPTSSNLFSYAHEYIIKPSLCFKFFTKYN